LFDRNPWVAQAVFPRIHEAPEFSMRTSGNHEPAKESVTSVSPPAPKVVSTVTSSRQRFTKRHPVIAPITMRRDGTSPQTPIRVPTQNQSFEVETLICSFGVETLTPKWWTFACPHPWWTFACPPPCAKGTYKICANQCAKSWTPKLLIAILGAKEQSYYKTETRCPHHFHQKAL
jgi:hypothetical protein